MSNPQLALLMLGSFVFIILLGFPIAFTLMAMGVMFGYYAYYQPGQDFRPPPDWEQHFNSGGANAGGFSFDEMDLADLFAGLRGCAGTRGFRGGGRARRQARCARGQGWY